MNGEYDTLISYKLIKRYNKDDLATFAEPLNTTVTCPFDMDLFHFEYNTHFNHTKIAASALLYIPHPDFKTSILSYQHETMLYKMNAPTCMKGNDIGCYLGLSGFTTVVPDYLGYGTSENLFHPYYDKTASAICVVDAISAALELLQAELIVYNNHLFLSGHSEGGYVTLATTQLLETRPITNLELEGVACSAGGYDLFHLLSSLKNTSHGSLNVTYICFLIIAYNKTNQWRKPLSYFFTASLADQMEDIFSGRFTYEEISLRLPKDLRSLFNEDFFRSLIGGGELELKKTLYNNSLINWSPNSALRLYHGSVDEVIPFNNSVATFENFASNNAPNVELETLHNLNHEQGHACMIKKSIKWFQDLSKI